MTSVDRGVAETRRVISALAEGDLTETMRGEFQGAFGELQSNVNQQDLADARDARCLAPFNRLLTCAAKCIAFLVEIKATFNFRRYWDEQVDFDLSW
ncbi:Methyl-accepting chemotaxis protein [Sinorhizobium alkalisoli]|nr:Methyl-accepting chemotaxis protein [Sinorhizobium alkalisoli]